LTEVVDKLKPESQPIWMMYKSGITDRSIMAMLYAMLVFTPAQIFMELMTGSGVGAVAWFTLLLWVEFARLSGKGVSKQEAFFILSFASVAGFPLSLIYMAWFRQSDIAKTLGITDLIPDWVAPPPDAGVVDQRTFLHPAWILPIGIGLLSALFGFLLSLGLSLFSREVYIEVERLPFPTQQMSGQGLEVLTEGTKSQTYIFYVSTVIGFAYSTLVYVVPIISQALLGRYISVIPIPFADLHSLVENVMPGAIFGIATTLPNFLAFWFVPFRVTLGTFLASIAVGVFGSWFSVIYKLTPDADPIQPGWQSWWTPGMDIPMALVRSTMFLWASILIGAGFAVGLAPIVGHPKRFIQAVKSVVRPQRVGFVAGERTIQPISFYKIILPLIVIGEVGGIALFIWLAPGFALAFPWIIVLMVLLPLLSTLIVDRLIGTVGTGENPFIQFANIAYWSAQLQYPGLEQWFAPNLMGRSGSAATYKVCQILETRDIDYVKMQVILWPVSIAIGYLFLQFFWTIGPIPSQRWPYVSIYWPVQAAQFGVMISGLRLGLLHVDWIIIFTIVLLALYVALDYLHSPIPYLAIAAGITMGPGGVPFMITGLIGALVAHMIRRFTGDEWWYENRMIIGAGAAAGTAISVTMAVAISMIANSIWNLPF